MVCVSVIVLRYRRPDLPRTFRAPGMPVVPLIGVAASLWLITYLAWQTWVRFAVWFLIGLVVYFGYSYRRSELAKAEAREREREAAGERLRARGRGRGRWRARRRASLAAQRSPRPAAI